MKSKVLRMAVVLLGMAACLAFAQDKDHDQDDMHHQKHHSHHMTVRKSHTYVIHHRGGVQTVTTYSTRRRRTGNVYYNPARPYYHPRMLYSQSTWEQKIRASRRHRHHHMSWTEAVIRSGRRHRHGRSHVVYVRRHDNGLHRGWYIGRGNPHRIGDHDMDSDDRTHHHSKHHGDHGHDKDDHVKHHSKHHGDKD